MSGIKPRRLDSKSTLLPVSLAAFLMSLMLFCILDTQLANLVIALCLAVALVGITIMACKSYISKCGKIINGYVLILTSFIVAYPLSAVVHLLGSGDKKRGFYDLVRSGLTPNYEGIYYALFLVFVALIALLAGLRSDNFPEPKSSPLQLNRSIMTLLGVIFTLLGLIGTITLFVGAPSMTQALLTVDRNKEIGGGLAPLLFFLQLA